MQLLPQALQGQNECSHHREFHQYLKCGLLDDFLPTRLLRRLGMAVIAVLDGLLVYGETQLRLMVG